MDRAFAALADPTRRAALLFLRDGPRRAGEIADALGLSPAGLSRHLRVLRDSGLVLEEVAETDARARIYRLEREPFAVLRAWIEDVEAFWAEQLSSFKTHAERTRGRRAKGEVHPAANHAAARATTTTPRYP